MKWESTADAGPKAFQHVSVGDGSSIAFKITKVPASVPSNFGQLANAKVGDKISGIYSSKDGSYKITKYMYMALGVGTGASSSDDGMTKLEFNMVSCLHTEHCDFSSANVPE